MGKIRRALGKRIQRLRKLKGMTQEGLAEKAGLSWSHVNAIEGGRKSASLEALEALSNALGSSPKELFNFPWPVEAKVQRDPSVQVYDMLQHCSPDDSLAISEILRNILNMRRRH
ncbi:MAG: helix-turn-helix transcriptional regulator [Nitrospirae bacterium]|nr:helix-turn-helix transcriptional regulator [Nitrospirota bacterium]